MDQTAGARIEEMSRVAVVAECDQGGADGRVDVTFGQVGCGQRSVEQVGQGRAHRGGLTGRIRERRDLGVGPEAGRGGFDGVEFCVDLAPCGAQRLAFGDDDLHAGAPALPTAVRDVRCGDGHEPCDIVMRGEKFGAITVEGVRLRRFVVGGMEGACDWCVTGAGALSVSCGVYSGVYRGVV
jgi:hypothetical protein